MAYETEEPTSGGESPDSGVVETTAPAQPQQKTDPEVARLQKEIEARDARINELSDSERYWADQAKGKRGEPAAVDGDSEDPDFAEEDPDKFTEALAATGIKALQKRGMLSPKQIREMVRTEAAKIAGDVLARREKVLTREGELIQTYPDLKNEKSEFFQATARILREEFADMPEFQRTPQALKAAAKMADVERKLAAKQVEPDEDLALRLASQPGRGARRAPESSDDGLGSQERQILAAMGRYGVTEADYKKQLAAIKGGRR